jgi:hypothetical protein
MGKRGRRSGAKSAGCASSASDECPYRVWSSAGDGSLSSGLGLGSGFGLAAGTWVGAGVADDFGSGAGALRVAAVVERARADPVGRHERGSVELAGASGVDAAETAKTVRTRAVRRRREEGAWVRDRFAVDTPAGPTSAATPARLRSFCLARSGQFSLAYDFISTSWSSGFVFASSLMAGTSLAVRFSSPQSSSSASRRSASSATMQPEPALVIAWR